MVLCNIYFINYFEIYFWLDVKYVKMNFKLFKYFILYINYSCCIVLYFYKIIVYMLRDKNEKINKK